MPLRPGDKFGPYEILAPIGAGGMGEAYRARDMNLDGEVAIKVLPDALVRDPNPFSVSSATAKKLMNLMLCLALTLMTERFRKRSLLLSTH